MLLYKFEPIGCGFTVRCPSLTTTPPSSSPPFLCYNQEFLFCQDLDEEAKRILEGLEQKKLEKGGEKAGVGKFTHASLEKNKKLAMSEKTGEIGEKIN